MSEITFSAPEWFEQTRIEDSAGICRYMTIKEFETITKENHLPLMDIEKWTYFDIEELRNVKDMHDERIRHSQLLSSLVRLLQEIRDSLPSEIPTTDNSLTSSKSIELLQIMRNFPPNNFSTTENSLTFPKSTENIYQSFLSTHIDPSFDLLKSVAKICEFIPSYLKEIEKCSYGTCWSQKVDNKEMWFQNVGYSRDVMVCSTARKLKQATALFLIGSNETFGRIYSCTYPSGHYCGKVIYDNDFDKYRNQSPIILLDPILPYAFVKGTRWSYEDEVRVVINCSAHIPIEGRENKPPKVYAYVSEPRLFIDNVIISPRANSEISSNIESICNSINIPFASSRHRC